VALDGESLAQFYDPSHQLVTDRVWAGVWLKLMEPFVVRSGFFGLQTSLSGLSRVEKSEALALVQEHMRCHSI
jgi:hypothetical protein